MGGDLVSQLRGLLHPIVVHFPIALLFTSVALDWIGYIVRSSDVSRAGFYVLALGAAGAGVAALTGPDHAQGDATVGSLLTLHESFALITVAAAVSLLLVRYVAADGLGGGWALVYLAVTLGLIAVVSLTGYYGGELTYHQGIGVVVSGRPVIPDGVYGANVPVKPMTALIGLLAIAVLGGWLLAGRQLAAAYYERWLGAARSLFGSPKRDAGTRLWTVWR
jgi:uncharacterized membrane protein